MTRGGYSFTVTATNGIGTGGASTASNTVVAPNVPGAPTAVTATSGNGLASVSWTAPATNGSTITQYIVTPYLNGTTAQATQTFNSTATAETVTGLTNGTAYTFKVAAINSVGTGTARRLGRRHPGHHAGGADHRHRHPRRRLGLGHLDGAGLQRAARPSPAMWSPRT